MFNRSVVFILGAGANCELGFPLGAALKSAIEDDLSFRYEHFQLKKGSAIFDRLIRQGFRPEDAGAYFEAAEKISRVIHQFISIDEALHYLSENKKAVTLGKAAIVNNIAISERRSSLYGSRSEISLDSYKDTWLSTFFKMLISGLRKEEINKAFENVTIINFNYDRSLEEYLFYSLQIYADMNNEQSRAAISKLEIIRPYGSLGDLDWQSHEGIKYGANEHSQLFKRAENIRSYMESDIEEIRDRIKDVLSNAWVAIFLGFGFHEQNMKLLKTEKSSLRKVYATTVGIDPKNNASIENRVRRALSVRIGFEVELHDYSSFNLLTRLRPSIMASAG